MIETMTAMTTATMAIVRAFMGRRPGLQQPVAPTLLGFASPFDRASSPPSQVSRLRRAGCADRGGRGVCRSRQVKVQAKGGAVFQNSVWNPGRAVRPRRGRRSATGSASFRRGSRSGSRSRRGWIFSSTLVTYSPGCSRMPSQRTLRADGVLDERAPHRRARYCRLVARRASPRGGWRASGRA
jgi:hypothetical protein